MESSNGTNNLVSKETQPVNASNSYKWTISNFTSKAASEVVLQSPSFFVGANDLVQWNLCAFLNGCDEEHQGYVSLTLRALFNNNDTLMFTYEFYIVDAKKLKVNTAKSQKIQEFISGESIIVRKFIKRNDLLDKANGFLTDNDELTIVCSISVLTSIKEQWLGARLSDHFEHIFSTKKFTDITFVIDDQEFHAHKLILAARSPVFDDKFNDCMKKNKQNRMIINGIKPTVFEAMLNFIYTDEISINLYENAEDMLVAANKYKLERLKFICEKVLCEKLKTCNTFEILIFAYQHHLDELKMAAIEHICLQPNVMNQAKFKMLAKDHSDLLYEIVQVLQRNYKQQNSR